MRWAVALVLVLCAALGLGAAEPVVSNVRAVQRPGQILVDITYDLASDVEVKVWIEVALSEDGGKSYRSLSDGLTGDYGDGIAPGADKRILWELGVEWLSRSVQFKFRITAHQRCPVPGMLWIEPGSFVMGSPAGESERYGDEGPQTQVTLTQGYWLGKHEVTQGEWVAVMGSNPSHFQGDSALPVECVSWREAMAYCQQVTKRERGADRLPAGYEFRLPTEAQWEYACRAATKGATAHGENLSSVQANFDGNYPYGRGVKGPNLARTAKVGSYLPNAWGLSDMHGNVREWCSDWYRDRLPGGSVTNPIGPATGSLHVYRSGDWNSSGSGCRSAFRGGNNPEGRSTTLGFRLALVAVP